MISPTVFAQLFNLKDFRVSTISRLLQKSFENLQPDTQVVGEKQFWRRGSGASSLNVNTTRRYASAMNQAMISLDSNTQYRV